MLYRNIRQGRKFGGNHTTLGWPFVSADGQPMVAIFCLGDPRKLVADAADFSSRCFQCPKYEGLGIATLADGDKTEVLLFSSH